MSRIIIGIHGLGNKPRHLLLRRWWKKSLREGLGTSGSPAVHLPFRLVYWADIVHRRPLNRRARDEDDPLFIRSPYVPRRRGEASAGSALRRMVYRFIDRRLDKVFLDEKNNPRFETFTGRLVRRFFTDLDAYYREDAVSIVDPEQTVRQAIQERLYSVLKRHRGKQILLVAHSMGSIVAIDVLSRYASELDVNTLVTIGSPLGLPNIKQAVSRVQGTSKSGGSRPHTPDSVSTRWYNLADPEDEVAVNHELGDDFDVNTHGVGVFDKSVLNDFQIDGKRFPHKSYGYLRCPEMADIVLEFLRNTR